jgi:hypothetical protein
MIAAALRLDWMVAVWADDEERFEEAETSGAGKGVFEANMAIARNVSYAWRCKSRRTVKSMQIVLRRKSKLENQLGGGKAHIK